MEWKIYIYIYILQRQKKQKNIKIRAYTTCSHICTSKLQDSIRQLPEFLVARGRGQAGTACICRIWICIAVVMNQDRLTASLLQLLHNYPPLLHSSALTYFSSSEDNKNGIRQQTDICWVLEDIVGLKQEQEGGRWRWQKLRKWGGGQGKPLLKALSW